MSAIVEPTTATQDGGATARARRRHLCAGWWSLLVFVLLGSALEALHGFKADFYLDPAMETRRLMWRLAHAHGTFLALVNVAFALSIAALPRPPRGASPCLLGALVAVPGGFFLGGVELHGGDPGVGIVLLPIGVLLLVLGVVATAMALSRR
jgi:hypothetical protein